jgi:hypothetical protein
MLAAYDEAALEALANKGIVRRAARDVEEGKVALVERGADSATIAADGETVGLVADGPAKSSCSCPSPGICRHRIAAVLLLRATAADSADTVAPATDQPATLIEEIAALAEEALTRFAGKAGWRAALEMSEAAAEIVEDGTALVVRLDGEAEVRYLRGLGIEGMVSKASPARRKALHTATLIAVRRSAGIEPAGTASSVPAGVGVSLSVDIAFLEEARAALNEACRLGLALAPLALEERLFGLSVSSRADALPRLGAMLRGVAGMIRARRSRSFTFDPDACLGLIAAADALVRALIAARDTDRLVALAGAVRQEYTRSGPLQLQGCGAETWRSANGARGVTGYFREVGSERWLTLSLARGAGQDPLFDPLRAYAHEAVWGGHTLATLTTSEITVGSVSVSAAGRMSSTAEGVTLGSAAVIQDEANGVIDRWSRLSDELQARLVGGLIRQTVPLQPVLLRPQRTAAPWFDDLLQQLCWPIEDGDGSWIILTVPLDPDRPDQFERVSSALPRAGYADLILAAVSLGQTRYILRPITLIDSGGVRALDLSVSPAPPRSFGESMRAWFARQPRQFSLRGKASSLNLLDEVTAALTGIAETGLRARGAAVAPFAHLAARARDAGFATLEPLLDRLDQTRDVAHDVLACRFVVDQLRDRLIELPLAAQ